VLHPRVLAEQPPRLVQGPIETRVRRLLTEANTLATDGLTLLDEMAGKYRKEGVALGRFFSTTFRRTKYDVLDPKVAEFHVERERRLASVTELLNLMPSKQEIGKTPKSIPAASVADDLYAAALAVFRQYAASSEEDESVTEDLTNFLKTARGNIDLLKAAIGRFEAGRASLAQTETYLAQLQFATWEFAAPLTSDQNARLAGTVSCTFTKGDRISLEPVAWTVTFQDPPRLSLSLGFLVTPLPKQKSFVGAIATARTDANAVTPVSVVQQTSTAPQILPMTLIQLRLNDGWNWSGRVVTINATPAVGINLNNKEAEFFAGLSLGIGNFYVSGGAHIGHLEEPGGGFEVGDRPTAAVPTLPLSRPWTGRVAAAISYRVPLK
jgi:hypothetical protein